MASAVTQTARQLAGAIGLALLIAILGATDTGDASVAAFQRAFIYLGSVAVLASLLATRLPSRSNSPHMPARPSSTASPTSGSSAAPASSMSAGSSGSS
ncbi:MAG: hypothetical protein AAFN30_13880 [Actinomycetota bacterium]